MYADQVRSIYFTRGTLDRIAHMHTETILVSSQWRRPAELRLRPTSGCNYNNLNAMYRFLQEKRRQFGFSVD